MFFTMTMTSRSSRRGIAMLLRVAALLQLLELGQTSGVVARSSRGLGPHRPGSSTDDRPGRDDRREAAGLGFGFRSDERSNLYLRQSLLHPAQTPDRKQHFPHNHIEEHHRGEGLQQPPVVGQVERLEFAGQEFLQTIHGTSATASDVVNYRPPRTTTSSTEGRGRGTTGGRRSWRQRLMPCLDRSRSSEDASDYPHGPASWDITSAHHERQVQLDRAATLSSPYTAFLARPASGTPTPLDHRRRSAFELRLERTVADATIFEDDAEAFEYLVLRRLLAKYAYAIGQNEALSRVAKREEENRTFSSPESVSFSRNKIAGTSNYKLVGTYDTAFRRYYTKFDNQYSTWFKRNYGPRRSFRDLQGVARKTFLKAATKILNSATAIRDHPEERAGAQPQSSHMSEKDMELQKARADFLEAFEFYLVGEYLTYVHVVQQQEKERGRAALRGAVRRPSAGIISRDPAAFEVRAVEFAMDSKATWVRGLCTGAADKEGGLPASSRSSPSVLQQVFEEEATEVRTRGALQLGFAKAMARLKGTLKIRENLVPTNINWGEVEVRAAL
ncbi:unnamed protein product [Amoebophrya sp. A120]|nr:unnamed protein product [Amoebophrya sp. A120]|eukprot:GSA120T00007001001.1